MKTTNLFIDDGGKGGLPIVFLHSLAGNTTQWSAQLCHSRQNRRALAIDLPGHGGSAAEGDYGDYGIEAMAQQVQATLAALGLDRFILVGHSLGGSVALACAGTCPQQVAGLLLVDPAGDSTQIPPEQAQGFLGALQSEAYTAVIEDYWQTILDHATDETQAQVMKALQQTKPETVRAAMQSLFNFNPVPSLAHYQGPRLSVITPLNEVPFALHNLVPDLPHILVTETSHWLHMDKPAQFNLILDDFINNLSDHE